MPGSLMVVSRSMTKSIDVLSIVVSLPRTSSVWMISGPSDSSTKEHVPVSSIVVCSIMTIFFFASSGELLEFLRGKTKVVLVGPASLKERTV